MNIFYLNENPVEAARDHHDKHVVKMILEYAQLLSTAHRLIDGTQVIEKRYVNGSLPARWRNVKKWKLEDPHMDSVLYAATHANHPSAIWARATSCNYEWLYKLFCATCDEYTYRYGKTHLTDTKLREALKRHPKNIGRSKIWVAPTPAMPDECKIPGDAIASYRKYYIDKKVDMAKWTNRDAPEWFIKGIKDRDAYIHLSMQELRSSFRKNPKNGRSQNP